MAMRTSMYLQNDFAKCGDIRHHRIAPVHYMCMYSIFTLSDFPKGAWGAVPPRHLPPPPLNLNNFNAIYIICVQ